MELLTAAAFLAGIAVLTVFWGEIPDMIVTKTSLDGTETMGSKYVLIFLPIFTAIFGGIITAVQFSPVLWNNNSRGAGLSAEKAGKVTRATLTLLLTEKLAVTLFSLLWRRTTCSGFLVN